MTATTSAVTTRRPARDGLLVAGCLAVFGVLLALVHAPWGPLQRVDLGLSRHVNDAVWSHGWLVDGWKAITYAGEPGVYEAVTVLLGALLWWRGQCKAALFAAAAVFGADFLDMFVKVLVARHRPRLAHPLLHATGASFPSGHAMTSFAFAIVVLLVFRSTRGKVVALVSALVVSASRLVLGAHYLTDLVAGWLLSLAFVLVVARAFGLSAPSRE